MRAVGYFFKLSLCIGLMSCTNPPHANLATTSLMGSEWGTDIKGQYIQFQTGGIVRGNGGCNQFSGAYNQHEEALTIGPLAATKMACAKLPQEQEFFRVLTQTYQADISHLKLTLKDQGGDILLILKRRDWD